MSRSMRIAGGPGVLVVTDQFVSAASNFLFTFVIVRELGATQLGRVSVPLLVLTFAISLSRASAGQGLLLFGDEEGSAEGALALSALLGLVAAVASIVIGFLFRSLGFSLLLATALIPLLALDTSRYIAIAAGHTARALAYDGLWFVLEAAGFVAYLGGGAKSAATNLLLLYVGSGTLSGLVFVGSARSTRRHPATQWIRSNVKRLATFAYEIAWQGAWANGASLGLAVALSASQYGTYRASFLVAAPLLTASAGLTTYFASQKQTGRRVRVRTAVESYGVLGLAALVGLLLLIISAPLCRTIFGATIAAHRLLSVVALVGAGGSSLALREAVNVRRRSDLRFLVAARTVNGPIEAAATIAGGVLFGPLGAACGYAGGNLLNAGAFFGRDRWSLRADERTAEQQRRIAGSPD